MVVAKTKASRSRENMTITNTMLSFQLFQLSELKQAQLKREMRAGRYCLNY